MIPGIFIFPGERARNTRYRNDCLRFGCSVAWADTNSKCKTAVKGMDYDLLPKCAAWTKTMNQTDTEQNETKL